MRLLLTLFFLSGSLVMFGQSRMNSSEIGYVYDLEHEFLIEHKVASKEGKHKIYFKFTLNSGNVKISDFLLSYYTRNNYTEEEVTNSAVQLDSTFILHTGFREFIYQIEIEEDKKKLVVLDIYNVPKNRRFKYDIPLSIGTQAAPPFLLFEPDTEIPYFSSYANKGDKIRIKDVFQEEGNFEITGFQQYAGIPMPPFDDTETEQMDLVPLDTLYGAQHDEVFTFHNEGYYKINASKERDKSIHLLVSDPYYPFFNDYKKLIRPLIFLSTSDEYQELQAAKDSRDGFEEFIQSTVSNNQRVAKDFIKYFYRRIRKSGRLFTTDRPGWKTDKGMIYLIFGDPLQVFRNEKTELWVYASGSGGRLRFVFDIVENDGAISYQLIRGSRYKEDWMTAVTQWRSGRIID